MKVVRKIGEISFRGLCLICRAASKILSAVAELSQKLSDKCKLKEGESK